MSDSPPAIVPQNPPTKRSSPLRFSLLSLCAVVAIACIAAAWYGMRTREQAALMRAAQLQAQVDVQQAEISRLRAELGYLTIADPSQVYVLQLESPGDYHWKWRIYLPPGKKWSLQSALGKIPRHGYKDVLHGWTTLSDGEFTLEAFFDRDEDGNRRFTVRRGGRNGGRSTQTLPEEDFQRLLTSGYSTAAAGASQMDVLRPGQPIEVIRLRQQRAIPGSPGSRSFTTSDEPEFGILIWLE